ncbi:hypothetical protein H0R92_09120 [Treponema sp. OMZ 840]|uniref:hypothetical protein n=1 Tax=Treponema sp. OMZ 840 TaxID=244313 RepID=UPI003D8B0FDC
MKKLYVFCAFLFLCTRFVNGLNFLYAEANALEPQPTQQPPVTNEDSAEKKEIASTENEKIVQDADSTLQKAQSSPLVFTFGAAGILNTDKNSAPSPVVFTIGAGGNIPFYSHNQMAVSFSPHANYFASYYLWDKVQKRALPAEIEQRAAYVPSLMLDIPVVFNFSAGHSVFSAGTGISLSLRFAARAINTSAPPENIAAINRWFWQNMRFAYPSVQFAWDYTFSNGLATGIGIKGYLSLGGIIDKRGLDGSMLMLCARIVPGKIR